MREEPEKEAASPVLPGPRPKMTFEEFLQWGDEDTWAEWVNGEVIQLSPASDRHQDLVVFLSALLRHFAEARQGGVVRTAPFPMKTGPALGAREPDIIYVAREHLDRLKKNYLDGPADIVVEIISPESRGRDRGEKFYEYEQAGVPEYWLVDYLRKQAEFYQRGEDGIYRPAPAPDGIFRSAVLKGLWLKLDWLWQDALPPLMSILKEWGLV